MVAGTLDIMTLVLWLHLIHLWRKGNLSFFWMEHSTNFAQSTARRGRGRASHEIGLLHAYLVKCITPIQNRQPSRGTKKCLKSVKCYPDRRRIHFIPSISEIQLRMCYHRVQYTRRHLINLITLLAWFLPEFAFLSMLFTDYYFT